MQARLYNFDVLHEEEMSAKIIYSQSIEEQYQVLGANAAIYAIIYKWLKDGMKEDIDFMTEFCSDILNKFYENK